MVVITEITPEMLVGTIFRGFYFRDLEDVKKEQQLLQGRRDEIGATESLEILKEFDEINGRVEEYPNRMRNKRHKWTAKFLDYDCESGLFFARAGGFYGESILAGEISGEDICFRRIYSTLLEEDYSEDDCSTFFGWSFPNFHNGKIFKLDNSISLGGLYDENCSTFVDILFNGRWRLDSAPIQ